MITHILELITSLIVSFISSLGYLGIIICMAIESACVPLPSEIIMPFSGFLVYTGRFNIWLVSLAGAFGCVVGSAIAYWAGMVGGRPFVEKYGKYILISHHDLDLADRWFLKYGNFAVFFSRLLPIVRTFISLPAGIARVNFPKFITYTFLGSLPWCYALALFGFKLGENWKSIKYYFHQFDVAVGVVIIAAAIFWIKRHFKK